ncbi:MAG TPA: alpha/beta hydrolase [Pirellulaceae bacterium]|nr:alpha/beta hydrolase [Pirellulaceae bacterium]
MARLIRIVLLAALVAATIPCLAQEKGRFERQLRERVVVETDVEYGKAGDMPLLLDVIKPKAVAENGKPKPLVVWIHGGAWQSGDKSSGLPRLGLWVAQGDYVGISVGYRLSGVATWPAQIHDCKAAIRWIRANADKLGIDPDKIGVWGSSAGGHLVSLLGTSSDIKALEGSNGNPGVSSQVACVVDYCGPSDFLLFARSGASAANANGPISKLLGGPVSDREAAAREASPVTYVTKDDPPFLVVHGTADRTVPFAQGEKFYEKLKAAGVDATFVKMDGGGHGIGGPEITARAKAFFDKHLLGKTVEVSGEAIRVEEGKQ